MSHLCYIYLYMLLPVRQALLPHTIEQESEAQQNGPGAYLGGTIHSEAPGESGLRSRSPLTLLPLGCSGRAVSPQTHQALSRSPRPAQPGRKSCLVGVWCAGSDVAVLPKPAEFEW